MLVTDRHATLGRELIAVVLAACRGGIDAVQLRDKDLPPSERAALAEQLCSRLPSHTQLIVSSDAPLAQRLGCGLHLPADAAHPETTRVRPRGRSAHDQAEIARAVGERADYILFGHVFETPSHAGHPARGPGALREAVALAWPVPVIAIGGIGLMQIPATRAAGAFGIAVRRHLLQAEDPEQAARALCDEWMRS